MSWSWLPLDRTLEGVVLISIGFFLLGVQLGHWLWYRYRRRMKRSDAQLAALRQEHEAVNKSLAEQGDAYEELDSKYRRQKDDWLAMRRTKERAESALRDQKSKLQHRESQVEDLDKKVARLERQQSEAVAGTQRERERRVALEAQLRQAEQSMADLDEGAQAIVGLQSQQRSLQVSLEELTRQLQEATSQKEEAASSLARAEETIQQLRELAAEKDAATSNLARSQEQLRQLRAGLQSHQKAADEARTERQGLLTELERQREQNERLQQQLRAAREGLARLETESSALAAMKPQQEAMQTSLSESHSQLRRLQNERDEALTEIRRSTATADQLRDELAAQREVNGKLGKQNERLLISLRRQRQESPDVIPLSEAIRQRQQREARERVKMEPPEAEKLRRDNRRGLIYVEPPQVQDDLKLIHGVADVLEKKLNDFGVYTYWQVMEWDETAVEEFSKLLVFKDRIERDEWIAQARRLHREKYGQKKIA